MTGTDDREELPRSALIWLAIIVLLLIAMVVEYYCCNCIHFISGCSAEMLEEIRK